MYDIITFGSATQDIVVKPKKLTLLKYEKNAPSSDVCFPIGSKIDVEDIQFLSGGGGTNTAASFALQGFKTAYCGIVGADLSARDIIVGLRKFGIDTKLISVTKEKATNHSVIISGNGTDRTIFAYRGAAELLAKEKIPWKKLKAKWLYLAPLSGLLCDSFEEIVDYAYQKGIKVAINPGMAQLSLDIERIRAILSKINVLFLNQEEASFLTKIPLEKEEEIFQKIDELCPGVAVMTKGGEGVVVSDGKYRYSDKPNPNRSIIDTTGAGDAFAAGFLSAYIRENEDIEKSIQLGLANSEGCLSQLGAKNGLLKKGQDYEKAKVIKEKCDNNVCLTK